MRAALAPTTAIVVVSHSARLARGVVEVAAQMAPDVTLRPAGGRDDDGLGTSFDRIARTIAALREAAPSRPVVVITDLGSATMTAQAVLESFGEGPQIQLADGPLVEGAVAAAVAAQGGAGVSEVRRAAEEAALAFAAAQRTGPVPHGDRPVGAPPLERTLVLRNELGLHARPAAMIARLVAGFDATVEIEGVDAASVLALMGLGLGNGDTMRLRASGPAAEHALDLVADVVESRFGEE
ncbi:dihydroxyacetone kinase phosphoryl donor subunit DhaM [Georgenia faecalis]|uniref:Phosphocarrier protein HPr n=1 Tax=Georgenia faecalis TaxID=2483799 RepID=A0ABV9DBV0_9MICO|nr:dihydroxyacetone kinase phosphoryl donor subunit DhaM [Georgenia faecalis]